MPARNKFRKEGLIFLLMVSGDTFHHDREGVAVRESHPDTQQPQSLIRELTGRNGRAMKPQVVPLVNSFLH